MSPAASKGTGDLVLDPSCLPEWPHLQPQLLVSSAPAQSKWQPSRCEGPPAGTLCPPAGHMGPGHSAESPLSSGCCRPAARRGQWAPAAAAATDWASRLGAGQLRHPRQRTPSVCMVKGSPSYLDSARRPVPSGVRHLHGVALEAQHPLHNSQAGCVVGSGHHHIPCKRLACQKHRTWHNKLHGQDCTPVLIV